MHKNLVVLMPFTVVSKLVSGPNDVTSLLKILYGFMASK